MLVKRKVVTFLSGRSLGDVAVEVIYVTILLFTPSLWNDSRITTKYEDDNAYGRDCGADVVEDFGIAGY